MKQVENETKDDQLFFADEIAHDREEGKKPWKVLIADDEEEVHAITRMVLDNFTFEGQGLTLLSAYSGDETKKLLQEHPDTAIVLLDVVMEEDTTGLEVAKSIRDELKNKFVRIILRTGQPGQAPEKQVTMDYDINDYKEKTELTAQKLFTTILGSLRAYRDLRTIEKSRKGLEQIVAASAKLFELQAIEKFATGVLTQLNLLLHYETDILSDQSSGFVVSRKGGDDYILAGTGQFMDHINQPLQKAIPKETLQFLTQVREKKHSLFSNNEYAEYFCTRNGTENLLYWQSQYPLNEIDKELIRVFSTNVAVAFDNIYLNQAIVEAQREVIFTLGEVIETRSKETGNHVKRIATYSHLLALKAGLSEQDAKLLRLASPMHDIGKIGIPDSILNKPGKLTAEEFDILKTHPIIGYNILKGSKQRILKTAATIALQHHEHWDGSGYPHGLSGEQIHIFARITKLVDVFDILCHSRIYEEAWDIDRVLAFIKEGRGTQFDPALVDLFLENVEELLTIKDEYPENV
jgi:response regulator RpfG family c-di-GMP phosphodiesterase